MIRLHDLTRAFGRFRLGPVTLALGRGEYWVLLGPSGAGKSMLLQTLAGIHIPDEGIIEIDGRGITQAPPEARGVGLVFQQAALFPHLSTAANIAYGLWARGGSRREQAAKVRELAATLHIEPLLERPVATLSGGEAQKVAIARALAPRPEVLLLDEPLGAVDHNARLELQEVLKSVHQAFGLTILHVTHHREEARALADHCALMLDGRLVQSGPTAALFERPRCFFVAHFLGGDVAAAGAPECHKSCLTAPGRCDRPEA